MGCASEHPSLHHQSLVQVFGVVGRPGYDRGTLKKASAKRDRRISKSATTTTSGGKTVNKSCDACSIKKRRCDGGRPCSRCVRRGDGHKCTYSTRRPYTSRNRRARLWSSSTLSSQQEAVGTASATRGRPCRKTLMDTYGRDSNRDQQTTRHRSIASPADSKGYKQNISRNLDLQCPQFMKRDIMSVVEASPPAGPVTTPISQCASPSMEEVYAELARAQQGVMSLIVSTNSLPLQASNNGPYQQTSIKQHCVPCVGDFSKLDGVGGVGAGCAEMMPRTVSLEEQSNPRSSDVPGLEIDCPVVASSASALESDNSTTDGDGSDSSSTMDLYMNIPSSWSDDGGSAFADVPMTSFEQHLPPTTSENIAANTTAASLDQTLSALGQEEQDIISAEDWFEVAAIL